MESAKISWHFLGPCRLLCDVVSFCCRVHSFRIPNKRSPCSIRNLFGHNVNRHGEDYQRDYRGGGGPPKPPSHRRIQGFRNVPSPSCPGGGCGRWGDSALATLCYPMSEHQTSYICGGRWFFNHPARELIDPMTRQFQTLSWADCLWSSSPWQTGLL